MQMNKLKFILISLLAVVLVSSCSSKKKLTKSETSVVSAADLANQKERYAEYIKKCGDFDLFQARAKYSFNGKSLGGRLNVEHGKRMKLTASVLGIEVMRIDINREQVVIVDKFDKLYSVISIDEFAEKLGLQAEMRYDALECLFIGRIFVPGKGEAEEGDFNNINWEILPTGDMLGTFKKDKYTLNYALNANNNLSLTAVKLVNDDKNIAISYEYADFQPFEDMQYPGTSTISFNGADTNISAGFSLSNPVASKNGTAFVPNGDYRLVTISDLMEAIKNLGK